MLRFLLSELRHRGGRAVALGLGILVAALSFTVLTAATSASRLRTVGTVQTNVRAAYDVLVRPTNSTTGIERDRGLVQDNYLSGIFGGISLNQYRAIRALPGVEVAAPIANLGYLQLIGSVTVDVAPQLNNAAVQLLRVRPRFIANGGLSVHTDADRYVYVTRVGALVNRDGSVLERTPSGALLDVCGGYYGDPATPYEPLSAFDTRARSGISCYSTRTPEVHNEYGTAAPGGRAGALIPFSFPILLSAIDPAQENKLVGLDRTLTVGRMLRPGETPQATQNPGGGGPPISQVPLLASSRSFLDETLTVDVQTLAPPAGSDVPAALASPVTSRRFLTGLPGRTITRQTFDAQSVYAEVVRTVATRPQPVTDYWSVGPVRYRTGTGGLIAVPTENPPATWASEIARFNYLAPVDNTDTQLRRVKEQRATSGLGGTSLRAGQQPAPMVVVVGRYDPDRLPGFDPLSKVPLESYRPPEVTPDDAASRRALRGQPLRPDRNIGGYLAQPPGLLTTLESISAFTNSRDPLDASTRAPISVIRVRVAQVRGVDALSRERVNQVALAIRQRTGLDVDITIGSSPSPQKVTLPTGRHGAPQLTVREGWAKKGVAVTILKAVDRKSALLLVLILLVCTFFAANAATASVRTRRTQLGVLSCMGWPAGKLFAAVLVELGAVGLVAGALGAAIAVPTAQLLELSVTGKRAVLVIPVATAVALLAGIGPAFRAARAAPADAVHPLVATSGPRVSAGGVVTLAVSNLLRLPGRTALGAAALAIGIAALTILLGLSGSFRGVVVGSLLGDAVALRVRGVDYLAAWATVALGAFSVADVVYLNVRERASEFATLRATGWSETALGMLVAVEGAGIGLLGSVAGAATGLVVTRILTGGTQVAVPAAAAGAAIGIAVTTVVALVPAMTVRRAPSAGLLAQD